MRCKEEAKRTTSYYIADSSERIAYRREGLELHGSETTLEWMVRIPSAHF